VRWRRESSREEEIDEEWCNDDTGLDIEPLVEEPPSSTSDVYSSESNRIVLSDRLKQFLQSCKTSDSDLMFKPSKTGKELVLYHPPSTPNIISSNIRDRIQEIHDWDEEELDDDVTRTDQVVTFPDSRNSSPTTKNNSKKKKSPLSSSKNQMSKSIPAANTTTSSASQSVDNVMMDEMGIEEEDNSVTEMEVD